MPAAERRRGPAPAVRFLVALLVTAGLLYLLIRGVGGGDELRQALGRVSWPELLPPLGLSGAALLLSAVRWRTVLRALDRSVTHRRAIYAVLATWPLAAVTPSRLADLLRALVVRRSVPVLEGIGSVLTEKLLDVQSLLLLAFVGVLGHRPVPAAFGLAAALVLFWGGFLWLPGRLREWIPRFRHRPRLAALGQLLHATEALRRAPRRLAAVVALSLTGWAVSVGIILLLLGATGAVLPWGAVLVAWSIAAVAGALPLTASGLGTRDGAFLLIVSELVPSPIDPAPVLAATLLYPLVTGWFYALVGLPFLARLVRHDPTARRMARGPEDAAPAPGWISGVTAGDDALVDEQPVEDAEASDDSVDGPGERR